ncbi:hypothetical protein [Nitrosovibrio sp. Nv17]|uniref:hypothetical protein n=1 Tax=Nitrosovibrio sp. Nv17 TaxID=1855339 RepID=UPI0015A68ACA|nr:hypothetical protein [Nitrosovibrio sp. Nv17]
MRVPQSHPMKDEVLRRYVLFFVVGPFFLSPIFALAFIDTDIFALSDERIFYIAVFFFFILLLLLMIPLFLRSLPQKPSLVIWIYRTFGLAVFAAFCAYLSGIGYFPFWNAVSSSGESVLVSGPVVHMMIGRCRIPDDHMVAC